MVASIRQPAPPSRSRFVTVIAWLSIFSSGSGVLGAIGWMVMGGFAPAVMIRRAGQPAVADQLPASLRFMMDHAQLFMVLFLLSSAVMFVSSIGLLERREWARVAFVWMLGFATLSYFGGVVAQRSAMALATASLTTDPAFAQGRQQLEAMRSGMLMTAVLGFLAAALINGLIIAKLCSAKIREEFDAADE